MLRAEDVLPELNATKAKIEQHISKTPLRNVSILIQRNNRGQSSANITTKTPSYMRDQSRLTTMNQDIESETGTGKLPPLNKTGDLDKTSDNTLTSRFAIKSKVFEIEMQHKSP